MFVAQSQTFMGVEVSTLIGVLTALGVLFTIWKKMNAARSDIVTDVLNALAVQKAKEDKESEKAAKPHNIGPIPLPVSMHSDCVKRGSYETHCRLNREEHARIERESKNEIKEAEREIKTEVEKIADNHNALSREVSELNARSQTNEQRLIQMDTKLDAILRQNSSRK